MKEKDINLLEKYGWIVECESPFEIRHDDESFATNNAAKLILETLKKEEKLNKLPDTNRDYNQIYNDFWKDIIEDKYGNIDIEQLKKELCDYEFMLSEVPKVYYNVTNGLLSKPLYYADTIINCYNDYIMKYYTHKDDLEDALNNINEDMLYGIKDMEERNIIIKVLGKVKHFFRDLI